MSERLGPETYTRPAIGLCTRLLGCILVKRVGPDLRRARIVEVEAYLGPRDLASHSSKGRTARTEVMFGPAGRAYVYFIYGMHWMFNIVAGRSGRAHAVLVRAAEPLDGWTADLSGPGKLAKHFAISREHNGRALDADDFHLLADPAWRPRIRRSKRIGVDYAGAWKDKPLRFVDLRNPVAARLKS